MAYPLLSYGSCRGLDGITGLVSLQVLLKQVVHAFGIPALRTQPSASTLPTPTNKCVPALSPCQAQPHCLWTLGLCQALVELFTFWSGSWQRALMPKHFLRKRCLSKQQPGTPPQEQIQTSDWIFSLHKQKQTIGTHNQSRHTTFKGKPTKQADLTPEAC